MQNILTYPTPWYAENHPCTHDRSCAADDRSCADYRSSVEFDFEDSWRIDDPFFADDYGLPIQPFTEDDLRFLRDFILSSAMYVEQLESVLCDTSDDFWEAREYAYRIVTALLIRHYEYELDG